MRVSSGAEGPMSWTTERKIGFIEDDRGKMGEGAPGDDEIGLRFVGVLKGKLGVCQEIFLQNWGD